MIKVALYLKNGNVKDVDLSNPEYGNPGVGGTQFLFVALPYYFLKYFPNQIEFIIYANSTGKLPENIASKKAINSTDALKKAEKDRCDVFVWRHTPDEDGKKFLQNVDNYKMKVVCWAHNTQDKLIDSISKKKQIKRFVCVSHEQLDRLRDHPLFYKSTYIFNGFDSKYYQPNEIKTSNEITYVGSLVPHKGFHALARIWPYIKEKYPEAKLNVIGTGKVYNRNSKLGKWNIADEEYEKFFRKHLSDEQGNIAKDVNFLGLLGEEKIPVMQRSCVGIVNPTGKTENCPGSAIEFQATGTPVVSAAEWGLLDTVQNKKTGLLGKSDRQLINNIVFYLKNKNIAKDHGRNGIEFIKDNFSYKKICREWKDLFEDVYNERENKIVPMKRNIFYNLKILREGMRLIKKYIPFMQQLPAIMQIKEKIEILVKKMMYFMYNRTKHIK